MSIALQRSNSGGGHPIEGPGFVRREMAYVSSAYDSPELSAADRRSPEPEEEDPSGSLSSSSSSSIGKNSDEHPGGGSGSDEEEVQSQYKGGPLDSLESLEEVLPVKKSISKFYSGKSKSFTSLSDAASIPSIKEITKPENAYTRKRKNLLAFNNLWDKNQNSIIRNRIGGISKRPTNSRSMLSLAASTNCSESNSGDSNSNSSPPGCRLPPLPPHARRSLKRIPKYLLKLYMFGVGVGINSWAEGCPDQLFFCFWSWCPSACEVGLLREKFCCLTQFINFLTYWFI